MQARTTRREFLQRASALAIAARHAPGSPLLQPPATPWYRRTYRWMQTNIAEIDPLRYDISFWRAHWKRTHTQGIIVNAGGIVAYYPTRVPMHRRAEFLGDRDLFGDLVKAAHDDGIAVFARMDSNGAGEELYRAHPDWFTRNASGQPYRRDQTLFAPCINGPYYREHVPAILREIAGTYRPEGFTDNSWSGLGRGSICYCANCREAFRRARGFDLPATADWTAAGYRAWIEWSYAARLEVWDLFNRTTRDAGGPDCVWAGMMNGSLQAAASAFRDYREICRRAEIVMLDSQHRGDTGGFQLNGQTGKLVHGLLGWDKLAPESFALYQTQGATFRLSSRPEPEVRLWAMAGVAAGIQPWWHYVNAYHEDRRQYQTPIAMGKWLASHEALLVNRHPIATIGIVYSQRNSDFFGRDDVETQVNQPQRGFTQALLKARIPYLFVHADDIERDAIGLHVLVLPNLGVLTDEQAAALRAFVARGGGLVATGAAGLCDRWGDPRPQPVLGDRFGIEVPADHPWRHAAARRQAALDTAQTYLRLTPELRAGAYGPHPPGEPAAGGVRHPILRGFDATDLLPFGGSLHPLRLRPGATPLLTFVPPRPAFPPEAVWTRSDRTDLPGLIVHERSGMGRIAYLPADVDRRAARDNNLDLLRLLANAVRWAAGDRIPLRVDGPGLLDWHLYRQHARAILHCLNFSNEGAAHAPIDELIPVGPLRVEFHLPDGVPGRRVRLLVAGRPIPSRTRDRWIQFDLASVADHELILVE